MGSMHRTRGDDATPPVRASDGNATKLAGVRPIAHDEDERPSPEDRDYGQTIFTRAIVPLPRLLRGRARRRA